MAYNPIGGFPPQQLSFSRKNKAWRKKCVDFGDNHSLMHYHLTRKSVFSMTIKKAAGEAEVGRYAITDNASAVNLYNSNSSDVLINQHNKDMPPGQMLRSSFGQ